MIYLTFDAALRNMPMHFRVFFNKTANNPTNDIAASGTRPAKPKLFCLL